MNDLSKLLSKLKSLEGVQSIVKPTKKVLQESPNQLRSKTKAKKNHGVGKINQPHPFKGKLVGEEFNTDLSKKFMAMLQEEFADVENPDSQDKHSFSSDHAKKHWLDKMEKFGPTTKDIDPSEYPSQEGLEGPFKFNNGRVLYFDLNKQQYYDIKLDMYIDDNDLLSLLKTSD